MTTFADYPDGTNTQTTYDSLGHTVGTQDSKGRSTSYFYDAQGHQTKMLLWHDPNAFCLKTPFITSPREAMNGKRLCATTYSSGIRRSELINLRLTDIDLDAGLLRVNAGMGNKDRMVPLGKIAVEFLKGYIKEVRQRLVKDPKDDHVFLSLQGRKICKCMLGLRLKDYLKKAGIEKDISIHTLRATCATHCLRGKKRGEQMHPRHLMELLGNSSMETLNPYLSVSIADLKEAHERCHPRERAKVGV